VSRLGGWPPADTKVPSFRSRVKWGKCGSRRNKIDVRPNWKEQPPQQSLTGGCLSTSAAIYLRPLLGSGMPEAHRLRLSPVQKILKRS
jgi:hypothetical protein